MSLKPQALYVVPPETSRVALAVFPKGNLCITISHTLGTVLSDEAFSELFQIKGQPAVSPWRLALVTILQFVERIDGSPSSRRSAQSDRLEVLALLRADGCRL